MELVVVEITVMVVVVVLSEFDVVVLRTAEVFGAVDVFEVFEVVDALS